MGRLFRGLCAVVLWAASAAPSFGQVLAVGDYVNGGILRFNPTTGAALGPLVNSGGVITPAGMTLGPDGILYVSNQFGDFISRHDPVSGAQVAPPIFLPANYRPSGLRFGANGELYIARFVDQFAAPGTGGVDRYNLTTMALTPVVGNLTTPSAFVFAPDGDIIVTEFNGGLGKVTRFDVGTNTPSTIVNTGGGGLQAPTGINIGPDGNLYVADVLTAAIRRYDLNGNPIGGGVFASGVGLDNPSDLLFLNGSMYVANLGANFGSPLGFVSQFNDTTGALIAQFTPNIQGASALAVVPVPEPTSLLLAGLGAIAVVCRRRKTIKE